MSEGNKIWWEIPRTSETEWLFECEMDEEEIEENKRNSEKKEAKKSK